MKKSCGLAVLAAVLASGGAYADTLRTFAAREDQRPGKQELEVGLQGRFVEVKPTRFVPQTDEYTTELLVRYGLTRDFSLNLAVPYTTRDTEFGAGENGLGDVRLGFDLVTYRDIFDYPYIMPYADVRFPTGDEEKQLGAGDMGADLGIALGSTVERYWHFVLDGRYLVQPNTDNVWVVTAGVIHELSKQFAVSVEGQMRDNVAGESKRPKALIGGMTYKPTKNWAICVFVGAEKDSRLDTLGGVRLNYTFR